MFYIYVEVEFVDELTHLIEKRGLMPKVSHFFYIRHPDILDIRVS